LKKIVLLNFIMRRHAAMIVPLVPLEVPFEAGLTVYVIVELII